MQVSVVRVISWLFQVYSHVLCLIRFWWSWGLVASGEARGSPHSSRTRPRYSQTSERTQALLELSWEGKGSVVCMFFKFLNWSPCVLSVMRTRLFLLSVHGAAWVSALPLLGGLLSQEHICDWSDPTLPVTGIFSEGDARGKRHVAGSAFCLFLAPG